MAKNNSKAALIRQQGNVLYGRKEFTKALKKYNESICWAENDSEELGIGYANRSVIYIEWEEYEFALANIELAKNHNYPQRLMPKLEARKCISRSALVGKKYFDLDLKRLGYRLEVNVDVNPRIPFLSNDVHVEEIEGVGRRVVADRDFQPGDVILQNRILLGSVDPSQRYAMCDFCTRKFFHSLIPCPNCVSVMFCGEDCRQKGWNYCHRFECGITDKLHDTFAETSTAYMGPRLFFYGLSLFDDDVTKMQQFCETHPRTGCDPFSLDYVNYAPLEEFKVIHTYKRELGRIPPELANRATFAANKYFQAYQASALVKSLFNSESKNNFLRHYFADYILAFRMNSGVTKFMYSALPMAFDAYTKAPNNPNVVLLNVGDQNTLVVYRPIAKGSQMTIKHFNVFDVSLCNNMPQQYAMALAEGKPEFPLCEWLAILELVEDDNVEGMVKMTLFQTFLQKHSHVASLWNCKPVVFKYHKLLEETYEQQVMNDMRADVVP